MAPSWQAAPSGTQSVKDLVYLTWKQLPNILMILILSWAAGGVKNVSPGKQWVDIRLKVGAQMYIMKFFDCKWLMNLFWVSRPSSLNVTLAKHIFLNLSSSLLRLWDTLPAAGCQLSCPPKLKGLDNIYCKLFRSIYIHLFIQTHFWHLSTRRVCPNCKSHMHCSTFMQGPRWIREGLLNSKT